MTYGIGMHSDDNTEFFEKHFVNWLKDTHMLPTMVSNGGIMRYEYQSQWVSDGAISQEGATVAPRRWEQDTL